MVPCFLSGRLCTAKSCKPVLPSRCTGGMEREFPSVRPLIRRDDILNALQKMGKALLSLCCVPSPPILSRRRRFGPGCISPSLEPQATGTAWEMPPRVWGIGATGPLDEMREIVTHTDREAHCMSCTIRFAASVTNYFYCTLGLFRCEKFWV